MFSGGNVRKSESDKKTGVAYCIISSSRITIAGGEKNPEPLCWLHQKHWRILRLLVFTSINYKTMHLCRSLMVFNVTKKQQKKLSYWGRFIFYQQRFLFSVINGPFFLVNTADVQTWNYIKVLFCYCQIPVSALESRMKPSALVLGSILFFFFFFRLISIP